jgi:hypothetical protein
MSGGFNRDHQSKRRVAIGSGRVLGRRTLW